MLTLLTRPDLIKISPPPIIEGWAGSLGRGRDPQPPPVSASPAAGPPRLQPRGRLQAEGGGISQVTAAVSFS